MKRLIAIFVTLAAILIAIGYHNSPTAQEKKVMAQFADSMETQCIGRYLIDFPKSFRWVNSDLTLYYGNDKDFKTLTVGIPKQQTTLNLYQAQVKKIQNKLAERVLFKDQKTSLLLSVERPGNLNHGVILNYYSDASGIGIDHQLHFMVGKTHVLIKGSSFEGSSSKPGSLAPAVKARVLRLAGQIRAVDEPENAGPGFCLGSVVVDSDNDYENADMTFLVAGHKDVVFSVWMTNQDNPSKTLHERLSSISALARVIRKFSIFRSRDLQVAGIPAQETLAKIAENRIEYQFTAELRPDSPSLETEGAQINLKTGMQLPDGRYVDSTLTKNEATALWDGVVASVRRRHRAAR